MPHKDKEKRKLHNKRYREENKEKEKERHKKYYQENKEKISKYYQENKDKIRKYRKEHKKHKKEYDKVYRVKHKEKRRGCEQRRKLKKKKSGGSYTIKEITKLRKESNGICKGYNREPHFVGEDKLTIDHIIPISKGGTSNIENIQLLCGSCNSCKMDKDIK